MKTFTKFREYVSEATHAPVATIRSMQLDMKKPAAINEINKNLEAVLHQSYGSPYEAYIRCAKVLRNYGVDLPKESFKDRLQGSEIFVIHQFGGIHGASLNGVITKPNTVDESSQHYFHFTWNIMNGFYKCSAKVVDEAGLNEIIEAGNVTQTERGALDPRQPR